MKPGERLPRIRELAAALQVTLPTLNQALRQLESRNMIERRPRSGIFVASQSNQKVIGLVMGGDVFAGASAPFYSMLLKIFNRRAKLHQDNVSFYLNLPGDSRSSDTLAHPDLVKALAEGKLGGLLQTGSPGIAFNNWLMNQGIPVVSLNKGFGLGSVALDYEEIIRIGASELLKQGCKTIGLVGNEPEHPGYFEKAAADIGFQLEKQVVTFYRAWDTKMASPKSYADQILHVLARARKRKSPLGLVLTDDSFASNILPDLVASGIKIGKELRIATHTNKGSLVLSEWKKQLTLLEVDPEELAEAMIRRLEMLMDGHKPEPSILRIRPHLKQ